MTLICKAVVIIMMTYDSWCSGWCPLIIQLSLYSFNVYGQVGAQKSASVYVSLVSLPLLQTIYRHWKSILKNSLCTLAIMDDVMIFFLSNTLI